MQNRNARREFLRSAAAGGTLLGLGDFSFLAQLPPVSAAEASLPAKKVRYRPEAEPMVTLLEQTPREKLLETVAQKIKSGTSYREVLTGLLLAAVRNVEPRPSVGFKFHAVLVVNSAHLASLSSADSDRWLPIFWAIDHLKAKQLEEEARNAWKMPAVDESAVPAAHRAHAAFANAMDQWDPAAADAAVAGLARTAGAAEVFELFYAYGARDYRSIGHKAIFVANSQRTLACIGWQHAEPVLRSLAYALQNHGGGPNPSASDLDADRPWRKNQELAATIRPDWRHGIPDSGATKELMAVLRRGSSDDACQLAVALLNRGVAPKSLWDAVFVGAGELLMRQPGIIGLHGLTTANALHYAYLATADDRTRQLLLLQNCAFLPMFRQSAQSRGNVANVSVDDLQPVALAEASVPGGLEEIFADVSRDRMAAAAKTRALVNDVETARQFIQTARRLIFLKGTNAHDYKFSSAVLEDYFHVSPEFRDQFLALGIFNLRGAGDRDNSLVQRTRAALA